MSWYDTIFVFLTNLNPINKMKNIGIGRYVVTKVAASNVPTVRGEDVD